MTPMEHELARELARLNARFYEAQAASFSKTRGGGWAGWLRCLPYLDAVAAGRGGAHDDAMLRVLDVAAGNLRLERFLLRERPASSFDFRALDACAALMLADTAFVQDAGVRCWERDLLTDGLGEVEPADFVACFGFMHHVPGMQRREELLRELLAAVAPGGLLVVSFWEFMKSPELAQAARAGMPAALEATGIDAAALDPGDYLLGWDAQPGVYRYCHSFCASEVDALEAAAHAAGARTIARFCADGRGGELNEYLLLGRD